MERRKINFSDGFTSETVPTLVDFIASTDDLVEYANDAAYETDRGAAESGNIYFNTTLNLVRYYNGASWINLVDESTAQTLTNKTLVDATLEGTTTIVSSNELEVDDANITINKNGDDVSAEGAGITVERTGVDGSIVYEDALTSKFKIGAAGSEVEVADVSSTQTLSNKTLDGAVIDGATSTITNLEHGNQVDNPVSGVHGVTGNVVGDSDAQTLTNKTIDADLNTISNLEHGVEVDNPTSNVHGVTGNIVGDADTQTLTNKTIDGDNNTITNLAHGAEVDNPSSGVHGVTGDVVGTTDTQTLTNKTINNSLVGGGTASATNSIIAASDTTANLNALARVAGALYFSTDDLTIYYDDGTLLTDLGASGGGGGGMTYDTTVSGTFNSNYTVPAGRIAKGTIFVEQSVSTGQASPDEGGNNTIAYIEVGPGTSFTTAGGVNNVDGTLFNRTNNSNFNGWVNGRRVLNLYIP